MSTIKIDGHEVPFESGDTIIRAAQRSGIDIPHYCWHPGLSVAGNCRMCLVEVLPPPGRPAMSLDVLRWDAEKNDYVQVQKPKLLPSCQVPCTPGLEILNDTSPHVEQARAAVQEMLLLNHPVDCPICDQAGECRLQDYWLEHQRTGKRMDQEILHKSKATVFGPTIVYDAERCVMCTRCIRVCNELAHDPVLSMAHRGNLDEIIVSPGRELDHDYTLMTEHVCPVGALTSSHFRFKARVWFLRGARTICQGCATGCNAYLDFDPRDNKPYRYRPRDNMQVNKYWMCDEGMLSYPRAIENRLTTALVGGEDATVDEALLAAAHQLKGHDAEPNKIAIVLSAQHSCEDNFALLTLAKTFLGARDFFVTGRPLGRGDDILMSADKNPNTRGVIELAGATPPRPISDLFAAIGAGKYGYVIGLGSEIEVDAAAAKNTLSKIKGSVVLAAHDGPLAKAAHIALPTCAWAEVDGTYVNRDGLAQRSERALKPRGDAKPGWALITELGRALGYAMDWTKASEVRRAMEAAAPSSSPLAKEASKHDGADSTTKPEVSA